MGKQTNSGAAYAMVHRATSDGRLGKETTCELCGIDCDHHRIEAHHHNGHDDPLNVWWLCDQCNARLIGDTWHSGAYTVDSAIKWLEDKYKGAHGYCSECNKESSPFYQGDVLVRYLG